MSNLLTSGLAYNPYFYVSEALRVLYARIGFANYVRRDLAVGKGSGTGDTVQVRRVQRYTTQAMPIALASFADVVPDYDNLKIDQWRGNGFKLTDKEKTLTPERFVNDHLAPVAASIADRIDADLASLILEVPWEVAADGTNPYKDFPNGRKQLRDNKAPIINPRDYAYAVDSVLGSRYEADPTFVQSQSDASNGELQRAGQLAVKFGFQIFADDNTPTYTSGTGALTSPNLTGAQTRGASSIIVDGTSPSGTYKRGTIIAITGDPQKYALKSDVTAATGMTMPIVPNLQADAADNTVVAFTQTTRTSLGCQFHRDAFGLVMQPLEDAGPGIKSAVQSEDRTNLSLRARIWGDGGTGATYWALDALWGYKALDPNLAARIAI